MSDPGNKKDFSTWNLQKEFLENRTELPYFNEREIWMCSIGQNIGSEQDGKGEKFLRPVIVIKKFNMNIFAGVPLTSKLKKDRHHFCIGEVQGMESMVILSQSGTYSSKRLHKKIGHLDIEIFNNMKSAAKEYIFGS